MNKKDLADLVLQPWSTGKDSGVEVPRNLVKQIAGMIVDARLYMTSRDEKKSYTKVQADVLRDDEELTHAYIHGPRPGVRYFMIGSNAQELIDDLTE